MIDELTRLDASVDCDPGAVAQRASELSGAARDRGCGRDVARACTTLARARRNLGEVDAAAAAIGEAIDRATPIGGDVLADAHLVAASITTYRDDASLTALHLDAAELHGSVEMRRQVVLQRAVLAKRAGRLDEALDLYETVLPDLRAAGDAVVTARVLSNRASIDVLRGRPRAALAGFDEARRLFVQAGQNFGASLVTENMAWAHVTLGEIPEALALLDEACEDPTVGEHVLQDAATSRAEALMTAGLFDDAIELLSEATALLAASGNRAGMAEAMLLHAEAARCAGDRTGADLARQARSILSEIGAEGCANHAHLEVLRATVAAGDCSALDEAEDLARRLGPTGPARIEVEAWSLTAQLALVCGQSGRARAAAEQSARRAAEMPFVEHRLAAAHATAAVQVHDGRHEQALATLVEVLDEFDRYRSAIGSPDARSSSLLHASALLELGADLVAGTGSADRILAWSEQRRGTVPTWMPTLEAAQRRDRRSVDTNVQEELRSVMARVRDAETAADPATAELDELLRRRRNLENELRQRYLAVRRESPTCTSTDAPPDMGDHQGVSLDLHGDRLLAIVVQGTTTRLVDLGRIDTIRPIIDAVDHLQAARARNEVAGRDIASTNERLQTAIGRLDHEIVRRLDLTDQPVVFAAPRALHALPWTATETLRNRSVSLVPSLSWWADAGTEPGSTRRTVAAVAGPRLLHAASEAEAVSAEHPDSRTVVGADATGQALVDAFAADRFVHVAAHVRLRHDNPMWSTVELVDGPLPLHRLARPGPTPELVILSTCHSGVAAGRSVAALPGFAAALLEIGVSNVIATTSLLPDSSTTREVVTTLHQHLAAGLDAATALRHVRHAHAGTVAADAFVAWGRS